MATENISGKCEDSLCLKCVDVDVKLGGDAISKSDGKLLLPQSVQDNTLLNFGTRGDFASLNKAGHFFEDMLFSYNMRINLI